MCACHHVGLAHALFGPRVNNPGKESLLAQLGTNINLNQSTEAEGRTTLYLSLVAPFLSMRRINVSWKNLIHMFSFSIHGRTHHLSLPNHDYLTSSRYLLFSFYLCLACHYFSWFGKEHRARHSVDRGEFLGQWCRADLFWTFPWSPRDAHLPFHNAGRSGSLGEGKWKGQMMKLKSAFGPGDNALF